MNALTAFCLMAILAVPLHGHGGKRSSLSPQEQIMISAIDSKLKPLTLERWKTAVLPPSPMYPRLSAIAGIQGELLMHCEIASTGRIVETRLVAGPPQLASTLDKWVRKIQFKVLPEDGAGPWHFPISAKFTLPDHIQIFPSEIKLLPAANGSEKAKD